MLAEAQTRLCHTARDEELELVRLDTLQIRPNTLAARRLSVAALDMDVELQKGLGDAFAAAVRTEEESAADLGIHAVLTSRFDDRAMVSGVQPPAPPTRAALEAIDGG